MYNTTKPYTSKIMELMEQTWETRYCSVRKVGSYPIIRKYMLSQEIIHTDGIGTKGAYHWANRSFKDAVKDAMAMNLNDLLMVKAHPYAMQNHIFLPEDDHKAIEEIVYEMAIMCKTHEVAMTGGETSIHDNMEGMEISITMSGIIPDDAISFKNRVKENDYIIGYESSGLHSNGFSRIRKFLPVDKIKHDKNALNILCSPTIDYSKKSNCYSSFVNGIMHITGGAYTKLKGILPLDLDIVIDGMNKIGERNKRLFEKVYNNVKNEDEMYKTFNCGIGLILSVSNIELLKNDGFTLLGRVQKGTGKIQIDSQFSKSRIEL